jgi:hypothetical protein
MTESEFQEELNGVTFKPVKIINFEQNAQIQFSIQKACYFV